MINLSFWKSVKEKWIRDNDPTVAATEGLVQQSGKSTEDINKLNQMLNGGMPDFNEAGSLDDINAMMEQLNDLGVDEVPFDDLFSNLGKDDE